MKNYFGKESTMISTKPGSRELLKDKRVIEEINRHLWIESEKAGYDIGFEKAADDWLKRFSGEWIKYHASERAGDRVTKKFRK